MHPGTKATRGQGGEPIGNMVQCEDRHSPERAAIVQGPARRSSGVVLDTEAMGMRAAPKAQGTSKSDGAVAASLCIKEGVAGQCSSMATCRPGTRGQRFHRIPGQGTCRAVGSTPRTGHNRSGCWGQQFHVDVSLSLIYIF